MTKVHFIRGNIYGTITNSSVEDKVNRFISSLKCPTIKNITFQSVYADEVIVMIEYKEQI